MAGSTRRVAILVGTTMVGAIVGGGKGLRALYGLVKMDTANKPSITEPITRTDEARSRNDKRINPPREGN